MKHILLLLPVIFWIRSNCQVFPIQVNPQLTPPFSPYLSDYTAPDAQNLIVHIRADDNTISDYRCKLRFTIEGVDITITTKQNSIFQPITLQGGMSQTLYGEDLWEYFLPNALEFSGFSRTEYEKSARLPEGIYRFTIEVLDYNRGTVVSNKGMTSAWIILNDPPMLNLPTNFSTLKIQDPTNILFTWTPRHTGSPNAAFTTEYIFRLLELWPDNRNPYDAFLTQPPLLELITSQTHILYGPGEPSLIPGRKYAWQLEARDTGGKDLFKNKGRSQVYVFQYGQALPVPKNLQMRWAKPTTLAIRWDRVLVGEEDVKYRLQYRPRKRSDVRDWYQTRTMFTEKTLYHLQTDTEYEMRVRTETVAQESDYTEIVIFKTLPPQEDGFVCKDAAPPNIPENTLPLFPLSINDTIKAGGYDVLVRDVMEAGGKYYGSGLAIVPWLNSAKVRVTFENIRVNDNFSLTAGTIKSVWNPESKFLLEAETPITAGNAPQTGELAVNIVATDTLITLEGLSIASVTKDEAGNTVVTTTDGQTKTLPKGESYAIVDQLGNGYVVDQKGNITKTTATVARATARRGARNYELSFRFSKGDGRLGFDEKKHDVLSGYYQQLDQGSYVPWKALSVSSADGIEGELQSDIDITRIRFEVGSQPANPIPSEHGKFRFSLQGKAAGMEEEFLAIYSSSDTLEDQVLGKINLANYNPIHYDLQIIPVNGVSLPGGLNAEMISRGLNEVYNQAVVHWNVRLSEGIEVALEETFDDGEMGVFSNYTSDMKKVLNAFPRLQDNTYYLFLIDKPRNPGTLGYMPRNKQAGFVFVGPHQGNSEEFLKTVAHELGHGAFNLKHIFSEHNLPPGSTDNMMDYNNGVALYKYQWDHIHQPQSVIGLFEGQESGMNSKAREFESEFTKRLGKEFKGSICLDDAVARGLEVYKRFDFDIALYSGFLRLMLCSTQKENCPAVAHQVAFSCGFTNALLQEIDWITMLESVEGWSINPEEILQCILDSYPIGSTGENVKLDAVVFKCLVGIEIRDLTVAIKDFIIANWDDPYDQGQATAFALTLLSPLKGKVLTRVEALPKYASKLDNFKSLAKAGNSDELVEISKALGKGKADDLTDLIHEVNDVAKYIRELPAPVGRFRQLLGRNNKTFRAADFWKQIDEGFKLIISNDGKYLIKHDPQTGRMLFADVESKRFIGFGLDEEDLVNSDYKKLLQNLKTVHGLPGGEKVLKIKGSAIPLSREKANVFFGKYNPNSVPGIYGEIGTDDIISELSILKNYSFADDGFELSAGSIHVLNIPENMAAGAGDFFDAYNKAFVDLVIKNRDNVNVVFVSDPRKVNLLRIYRNGIATDDPTGLAKEIRYLRDRGIADVKFKDGTTVLLKKINLENLNWSTWKY